MNDNLKGMFIPSIIAFVSIAALLIIRSITFRVLHRWAQKTETDIDDIVITAFKTPSFYWCVAIGLHIGIAISDLPDKHIFYLTKTIHIVVILSIAVASANLAERIFTAYIQRSNLPIPTTGLVIGILKGTILILGLLIALSTIGISIAPFITALGVGGFAVALALQDTLSNLFAGIHILVERSIRVGDFVRLETGQEGYVEDITWRTTRIRMRPNNMVIIPNNKLSQSIVTNYYLPEESMALSIPVSVSYASDPERVEKVLLEEVRGGSGRFPASLLIPDPWYGSSRASAKAPLILP